jgi:hypothetical protein
MAASAVQASPPGVSHVEAPLGPRHAHVAQPALLLEVSLLDRPHVGEDALLAADDQHRLVLEPLRVVERHQGAEALVAAQRILVGVQGDLGQELLQGLNVALPLDLAVGVELPRHPDQLLEVLDPPLGLDRALGLERLQVARVVEHGLEHLGHRGRGLTLGDPLP